MPHTLLIYYSSVPKHPSKSDYSTKTPQRIGWKTWKWLWVEVIACGVSWSEIQKEWILQGWLTKKPHSLVGFLFGVGVFKGCNTLLWKHTCNDLWVFKNDEDKPRNFSGVFLKVFPQPACFFFLEQTTDRQIDLLFWVPRYPAQLTGLELLFEPPQNIVYYKLHPTYTYFSCFPIIWSSAIWKSLLL